MELVRGYAPRRNTKMYAASLGSLSLFFSYDTLIGASYSGYRSGTVRLHNRWGPTTGRHFNEHGLQHARVVSEDELQAFVAHAVQDMGMRWFKETLEGKKAA